MTGKGLICRMGEHQPIEGADFIVQVPLKGEIIITQKTSEPDTLGVLFDCETQLSHEFCATNNLYSESTMNANVEVKGYIGKNRRIRPIRLKGVKCSAMWMSIDALNFTGNIDTLKEGDEIDVINGIEICRKYITPKQSASMSGKQGKARENLCPTFREHIDTDQWGRNNHKVQNGDVITITEKLHGTSCRAGLLPTIRKKRIFERLLNWIGIETPETEYKFVVGSRRVTKSVGGEALPGKKHFYDSDLWTKVSVDNFEGNLRKGETVYFEVLGYNLEGGLIMPMQGNDKLKKFMDKKEYKEFIERYGITTTFTYGNGPGECSIAVYRITFTDPDGNQTDLSERQVARRCEQLGVPVVPTLDKFIMHDIFREELDEVMDEMANDYSELYPEHLREGIVIRIDQGDGTPLFLKHKAYLFKVLEGIIKDNDDYVDTEEAS